MCQAFGFEIPCMLYKLVSFILHCTHVELPLLDFSIQIGKGAVTELIQHRQFTEPRVPALGESSEPEGRGLECLSLWQA